MLNQMTLILISVAIFCGCSDSAQDVVPEAKPSVSSAQKKPASPPPSGTKPATDQEFNNPRDVLVPGQITVDVMGMAIPKRAEELGQQFKKAIAKDPNWLLEHSKKNKNRKPGEPLPYDKRMGLTEAEYNEFITMSKKMTMQKMKEVPLIITQKGEDIFVLDGGKELSDLTGIEIDLKQDQVQTPFGVLTERSIINAPEHTALGAWNGVQWRLAQPESNAVAKLAMGKLKQSGRCVIYYDVRKISPEEKTRISHVLNYDAP